MADDVYFTACVRETKKGNEANENNRYSIIIRQSNTQKKIKTVLFAAGSRQGSRRQAAASTAAASTAAATLFVYYLDNCNLWELVVRRRQSGVASVILRRRLWQLMMRNRQVHDARETIASRSRARKQH